MKPPDFPKQFDEMWSRAENASGSTVDCHYVSQFFMKRWGVNKILTVEEISTGAVAEHSTACKLPIAMEPNLYTLYDGVTVNQATLENFFGQIESDTGEVLKKLAANSWVMSEKQKSVLAKFAASMIVRLPVVIAAIMQDWQREFPSGTIQKTGNTAYALLKVGFPNITQKLFDSLRWTIIRYPNQRQRTSDIPLILATHNREPVSTDPNRWEIFFPLDPHALLVINGLSDPFTPLPTGVQEGLNPLEWNAPGAKWRIL